MTRLTVQGMLFFHSGPVLVLPPGQEPPAEEAWDLVWEERCRDDTRVRGYRLPRKLTPGTPDPRD